MIFEKKEKNLAGSLCRSIPWASTRSAISETFEDYGLKGWFGPEINYTVLDR
jgi:hypothetical protein